MRAFANTLRLERNLHGATTFQESIVEIQRRVLGADNLETASSMYTLAVMLWEAKEIERVGALLEQALSVQRRELGEENLDTLNTMSGLASCFMHSDFDKARSLLEQVVTNRRRVLGDEHVDTLRAMEDFANALWNSDRTEATKWMVRAAKGLVAHADLGPGRPRKQKRRWRISWRPCRTRAPRRLPGRNLEISKLALFVMTPCPGEESWEVAVATPVGPMPPAGRCNLLILLNISMVITSASSAKRPTPFPRLHWEREVRFGEQP